MNQPRQLDASLQDEMRALLGERLTTSRGVREHHGKDESYYPYAPPDAVVFAHSTEEVRDIINICRRHKTPMIPYGVGTSLEGHTLAINGGVCVDLSQMNKVLAIHAEDLDCTVQAGVTRKQLNEEVRHTGLFFPVDPGADATLGGMASTRASGTNAVRYGTMRENVLALEVVTACGEVIRTGTRAKKSSAGYDLTRLFVGSEGTLGVITEVTVRLYPLPEAISAATCSFPSIAAAVQTVIQVIQMGVPIARVELIDHNTVRMVNKHAKLSLREEPMLLMEFHGSPAGVQEQAQTVQEIANEHGGNAFEWATTPEERTRLWAARHNAYFSALQSRPGCRAISTDTCVPISKLADCLLDSIAETDASGLPYFLVGHVGDGNFHFGYLINPEEPREREVAEDLNHKLVSRALRLGGTCTGEHGIGLHKIDFLVTEAGEGAVNMMRTLKKALDPLNIMNPGKIFTL